MYLFHQKPHVFPKNGLIVFSGLFFLNHHDGFWRWAAQKKFWKSWKTRRGSTRRNSRPIWTNLWFPWPTWTSRRIKTSGFSICSKRLPCGKKPSFCVSFGSASTWCTTAWYSILGTLAGTCTWTLYVRLQVLVQFEFSLGVFRCWWG